MDQHREQRPIHLRHAERRERRVVRGAQDVARERQGVSESECRPQRARVGELRTHPRAIDPHAAHRVDETAAVHEYLMETSRRDRRPEQTR